jgi:hypothetical protein
MAANATESHELHYFNLIFLGGVDGPRCAVGQQRWLCALPSSQFFVTAAKATLSGFLTCDETS